MKPYRRIRAEISLDAIDNNLDVMTGRITDGTKICAVIKADGYGHGATQIARHIEGRENIWGFACAACEEAVDLRKAGIKKPILLLGYTFPEAYEDGIRHDIRITVFTYEDAVRISDEAMRIGKKAIVHVAVDTGMSRIGFDVCPEAVDAVENISVLPGITIEGLFTHFARADETSFAPAEAQFAKYRKFLDKLKERGILPAVCHVSNSSALMRCPEANLDMVRAGITLYGLMPSHEVAGEMEGLEPVMRLVSHVSFVKTLPAGRAVSYGGTFVTERETRVATVPAGYADGYPRMLSGKAYVLVGGKRAPILGRVCMDQFMIDVTQIEDVKAGDEVVLIGRQGDEVITAEQLGDISGRFNYELVCNISKRVPRLYMRGGTFVESVDYFA